MQMKDYQAKCLYPTCDKVTSSRSQKCAEHRKAKCAIMHCKEMVIGQGGARYCPKHISRRQTN